MMSSSSPWSFFLRVLLQSLVLLFGVSDGYSAPRMTIHSDENPISSELFGEPFVTPAPAADLAPGVHPRLLYNAEQLDRMLQEQADTVHDPDSWVYYQFHLSKHRGPESPSIQHLAGLDLSAYIGDSADLSSWTTAQRETLKTLATEVPARWPTDMPSYYICSHWALVNEKLSSADRILPADTAELCRNGTVAWATALLAHRAYYCASDCSGDPMVDRSYIWDVDRWFTTSDDWHAAGASVALALDLMYDRYTVSQRRRILSALALLVLKKETWGCTEDSTAKSPNAAIHPHRIFSNWAMYHGNLFVMNLILEHEDNIDTYARFALQSHFETSPFNIGILYRYDLLMNAYFDHSIYPDGSTFEDGYTYQISMTFGALAAVVATRRGSDLLTSARFRGHAHFYYQMSEPWQCGRLIGHASGGGQSYVGVEALFKYAYPKGAIPALNFRHRMGTFKNNQPCRINFDQSLFQSTALGSNHDTSVTTAESAQGLSPFHKNLLPKSIYAPRRGLVIMRNGWNEDDTYVHFDARPDSFVVGHDNSDRGVFTFTAMRQSFLTDYYAWNKNVHSRMHSLIHVDGLSQDEHVPTVRMVRATDDGEVAIAAANLTYAFNVQWARGGNTENPPRANVVEYTDDTNWKYVSYQYTEKADEDIFELGWQEGDTGADIGMQRPQFALWGDPDLGFSGQWEWKRNYRRTPLDWVTRSVALVRSKDNIGYLVVADSIGLPDEASHKVESYLMLHDGVSVNQADSSCVSATCTIVLMSPGGSSRADIHIRNSKGVGMDYRVEIFTTDALHKRIVVRMQATVSIDVWHAFYARVSGSTDKFSMSIDNSGLVSVWYYGQNNEFRIDGASHIITEIVRGPSSSPSTSNVPSQPGTTSPPETPTSSLTSAPSVVEASPSTVSVPSPPIFSSSGPAPSPSMAIVSPRNTMVSTVTPSSSPDVPVLNRRPIRPVKLGQCQQKTMLRKKIVSNGSKFYHYTDKTYQTTIQIRTLMVPNSNRQLTMEDEISTCVDPGMTRSMTTMKVFDCGVGTVAMGNYYKRRCNELVVTDEIGRKSTCPYRRKQVGQSIVFKPIVLQSDRPYFVVVSGSKLGKKPLKITVEYSRTYCESPIDETLMNSSKNLFMSDV